jgi:hypothetical protein
LQLRSQLEGLLSPLSKLILQNWTGDSYYSVGINVPDHLSPILSFQISADGGHRVERITCPLDNLQLWTCYVTFVSHCILVNHSIGGLILDKTVSDPNFEGMAVFTPVINGEWTEPNSSDQRVGHVCNSMLRFTFCLNIIYMLKSSYFLLTNILKEPSKKQLHGKN